MTDSPTQKKRFGAGICWEYMDKGACPCCCESVQVASWHPKVSVSKHAATSSGDNDAAVVSIPKRIPEWIESLKYLDFVEGDPENFAILNTIYEEREEAKTLGASFAPGMKKWIVVQGQDLEPFARWKPKIKNRSVGEVVMYNQKFDMTSTVRELQRCGVRPLHFKILGSDAEAENLRMELSNATGMQERDRSTSTGDDSSKNHKSVIIDLFSGDAGGVTRTPALPELHATTTGENNNHTISAKRPRFSTPESLQTFVRQKQHEQAGNNIVYRKVAEAVISKKGGGNHQNELSSLLSTAKSALVRCHSAGGVNTEQKQFNEAIFNMVGALASNLSSSERNNVMLKERSESPRHHARPMKTMVTPTTQQKMGAGEKAPGIPGTWYDSP